MEFALELILELYGDLLFEFLPQKAKGTKKRAFSPASSPFLWCL